MVQKADVAQKAFLSNNTPSLHLVLPALEVLHNAWTDHSKNPKYGAFVGPLGEGIEKIADCYDKTSFSDTFNFSMYESDSINVLFISSLCFFVSTTSTDEDGLF